MLRSAHLQDTDTTASLLLIEFCAFLRYNIACAQASRCLAVLVQEASKVHNTGCEGYTSSPPLNGYHASIAPTSGNTD